MKFPQMLKLVRKQRKLSQIALRKEMASYGQRVSVQLLSKWENGHSTPNLAQFFALCEILGVDNPAEYFSDYRITRLNMEGLRKVQEYQSDLIATGLYSPEEIAEPTWEAVSLDEPAASPFVTAAPARVRLRPLYLQAAAAGTGQFLDSSAYEMAPLDEDAPDKVSFGIRVAGDSMEPRYQDGQIVWVQKTDRLENGQIGIFYLDGDSYIKKFFQDKHGIQLQSLNPAYSPIKISETSDFRVFGRVIAESSL